MKTECKVSVIVPIYNAEDYLEDTINSILNQEYTNIEIVLVNDGSIDKSLEKCKKYEFQDERVILIDQNNQGQYEARKNGVMHATGEYVCFVDSDDYVKPGMIQSLMEHKECDLVVSSCNREEKNGEITLVGSAVCDGIYVGNEKLKIIKDNVIFFENTRDNVVLPYMVGKLYRMDILRNIIENAHIDFTVDEDRAFNITYMLKCDSIYVCSDVFYLYHYNPTSIMRKRQDNYLTNLNRFYLYVRDVLEENNCNEKLFNDLERFVTDRLYLATEYMKFKKLNSTIRFGCPISLENYQHVLLYGIGVVGKDYYRQIKSLYPGINLCWTDKYTENTEETVNINEVNVEGWDIVILAVKSENIAEKIKKELVECGFYANSIIWNKPIDFRTIT